MQTPVNNETATHHSEEGLQTMSEKIVQFVRPGKLSKVRLRKHFGATQKKRSTDLQKSKTKKSGLSAMNTAKLPQRQKQISSCLKRVFAYTASKNAVLLMMRSGAP